MIACFVKLCIYSQGKWLLAIYTHVDLDLSLWRLTAYVILILEILCGIITEGCFDNKCSVCFEPHSCLPLDSYVIEFLMVVVSSVDD